MRQIYSLIFRSTDLEMGQSERANLLNKSINGRRRPNVLGSQEWGFFFRHPVLYLVHPIPHFFILVNYLTYIALFIAATLGSAHEAQKDKRAWQNDRK